METFTITIRTIANGYTVSYIGDGDSPFGENYKEVYVATVEEVQKLVNTAVLNNI